MWRVPQSSNPQGTHVRQIVKYFAGYFHVCPCANLTILQHIWNAPHRPPDQAEGSPGEGRHLFMGGFPLAVWVSSAVTRPIRPGYSVSIASEHHPSEGYWDRESRYNDCLWSVSVPAPGPRVVTQSWHCHAVTRLVWCDVMSGGPRQTLMGHRPRQADLHTLTGRPWLLRWADPSPNLIRGADVWLMTPSGPWSSALSRIQPQSIQGIYWDLSKQRISKLYRFYISNNPSPRIRPFKSQSNLTSDHWPGSISPSLRIPSCPGVSASPWCHLDPSVIVTPASCHARVTGCQDDTGQHCDHVLTLSSWWRGWHGLWPRYQDTLAASQHLEIPSGQIIQD